MWPRILVVTENARHPPRSGGAQRTALLVRALRTVGEVELFFVDRFRASPDRLRILRDEYGMVEAVTPWADPRSTWRGRVSFVLRANLDLFAPLTIGMARAYAPEPRVSRRLAAVIARGRYDVIVGRYLRATTFAGALDHPPVLLDLDDHDLAIYASRLEAPGVSAFKRLEARRALRQLQPIVPALLARCAHVWVSNADDAALVGNAPISILPNIPYGMVEPCPPAQEHAPMLLVGTLDYDVNARAVDRFVAAVWPRIHAACPGARLRIVGTGISRSQRRRWSGSAGVEAIGPVDDLHAEYAAAGFALAPIFEGGGTKIKVLEALRHGRTVVASGHAQRGFEHLLRDGESLVVAADEAAFAAACIDLWNRPDRAAQLAKHGAAVVSEHYSFESFRRVVAAAVDRVCPTSGRSRAVVEQ